VVQAAPRAPDRWTIDPTMGERHPLRLLLAEDNAVNQKLAIRLLERMGYTADIAGDGLEAIAALEARDYDVVLMDVQMPELDGLEATRRIRSRWPERPLRIIAMTANAMEGDRDICLAAGMDEYVSKPIHPDELARALDAAPAVS
jgi:CheY-like chemotaxis protein